MRAAQRETYKRNYQCIGHNSGSFIFKGFLCLFASVYAMWDLSYPTRAQTYTLH